MLESDETINLTFTTDSVAMVQGNAAELCIDELILQVFEEQEDVFCFPIRSQKDARVFVKALHCKGLPFESICGEIEEFEYNFSAWRKGLGRPGIGKRVLERLNRPLQELLDEDEDELYARSSTKGGLKANVNGNKKVTTTNDNEHLAQARLTSEDKDEINAQTNSRSQGSDEVLNREKLQENDSLYNKEANKDNKEVSDNESKVNSLGQDSVSEEDMSEKESSTEPETEDTEKGDSGVASDKEDITNRIAMFEAKRGRKAEEERQKELLKEREEREKKDREDRERERLEQDEKRRLELEKERERKLQERKEQDEKERAEKQERENNERVAKEKKDQEEKERMEQEKEQRGKQEREEQLLREQEEKEQLDREQKEQAEKERERKERIEREVEKDKENILAKLQNGILSDRRASFERKGSRGSLKEFMAMEEKGRVEAAAGDDSVDENYNSDLDPENSDQSPVMAKIVQKISSMRSSSKNSSGYIYVFSDGKMEGTRTRVKIGTSRFPQKRLRQSQVFNPDMFQVTTVAISQRITVMKEISEQLHQHSIVNLKNWFEGDVDDIVSIINSLAAKYPSKLIPNSGSSDC